MSLTMINGKPRERKQLSDQIDRLDSILDGLADALNEAVADASREGARVAVKEAIFEILTNPDLRSALVRADVPPPVASAPESPPNRWSRLKGLLARIRQQAAKAAQPVTRRVSERCRAAQPILSAVRQALHVAWQFRREMLVGAAVGLVTLFASYEAPRTVAAVLSGIGGLVTAVAVQGGLWLRAACRKLGLC